MRIRRRFTSTRSDRGRLAPIAVSVASGLALVAGFTVTSLAAPAGAASGTPQSHAVVAPKVAPRASHSPHLGQAGPVVSSTPRMVPHDAIHQTFTVNTQNDTHLANPSDTNCIDGSGNCSLRAAIEAADNDYPQVDQINVPAGYVINVVSLGELNIYNSMFITGLGGGAAPAVDGGDSVLVMDLYSNTSGFAPSIELTNLTIENGRENSGGDIYEGDGGTVNLTLSGTTITGGTATGSSGSEGGGGIYINSDSALWTDPGTTFSNSTAAYEGGAIFNNDGQVFVGGSTFSGNSAASLGGAVYQDGGYVGDAAHYTNNSSPDGGVFYNDFTMSDTGGTYSGNTTGSTTPADSYGNVMDNEDSATVSNATVTGSSATATNEVYGGAFYNDDQLALDNVSVSNSTNRSDGGDVYGGVVANDDNLSVSGLTVSNVTNGASGVNTYIEGGAVYNDSSASVTGLTVSGITDTADGSKLFGGAVSNESGGTYDDVQITGTAASSNSELEGGAIYTDAETGLNNVSIGSTIETAGGVDVYGALATDSQTTVNGLSITGTTVNDVGSGGGYVDGGGWYNGDETSATNVQILDTSITADDNVQGGAFSNDGDGTTITNGTFARTTSNAVGSGNADGSIAYLEEPMTLTNVTMADNTASVPAASDAYGIYLDDKIQFVNDTIANNALTPVGGSFGANAGGFGFESGYTESLLNTIVQFNGVPNCTAGGIFASSGGNIDSGSTCGFTLPSDQQNTNPMVNPLANNGGAVQTAALMPGSPAIGRGVSAGCPSADARGVVRPVGQCDVGAFQLSKQGYWEVASDGGIFNFANAGFYGSMGGTVLNSPVVGMAATPDGKGYWEVAADGGIFNFGDAGYFGSMGGRHLNLPIVGMAATADGQGYWLVASDGGIFNFGDAGFFGSAGSIHLNMPVVGMAGAPNGKGYWLVASDGGIFNYGSGAGFFGSAGSIHLNKPVVGMAAAPSGTGYWLVATDGGIFNYGPGAGFFGSAGSLLLNKPVVGMARSADGAGYWLFASDGGVFNYGDATFQGSMGGTPLNKPVVGGAANSVA